MGKKNKTVGYGFVGRWKGGDIGWCLPRHLTGHARNSHTEAPSDLFHENANESDRAVLCKITVEVIHDSRGREITRKPKKEEAAHAG